MSLEISHELIVHFLCPYCGEKWTVSDAHKHKKVTWRCVACRQVVTYEDNVFDTQYLLHFSCGECKKWWSEYIVKSEDRKEWCCTWCGAEQRLEENKNV